MTVFTTAGSTLEISAATPATFDQVGYEALSFTNIGEITDPGDFGREYALVTHNPVADRGTVKRKGSFNEGSKTVQLGLDTDDAGQILAKAAVLSDAAYSFKETTQNGDVYYYQALAMGFRVVPGQVDSITSATMTLELTTTAGGVGIVEVLAA